MTTTAPKSTPSAPAGRAAAGGTAAAAGAKAPVAPAVAAVAVKGGARRAGNFRRLWQIPLLLAGLAVFGVGTWALSRSIKAVPFETHVKDIRGLIDQKKIDKAIAQINKVSNYYGGRDQLATLELLAGDAYAAATHEPEGHAAENFKQLIAHYRLAEKFGASWDSGVRERVGEAALELGDHKLAVEQLEKVVHEEPESFPKHARQLFASYLATGESGKAHEVIGKLLTLPGMDVGDRVWALCSRIELALTGSAPGEVDKAIAAATDACKGIPERDPGATLLTWIGRAEFEAGRVDEARRHLTDARGRFVVHTLDYGRAALLLGKISQAKGELPEALGFFQEVITSHPGSALYAAARLGRAEVLSAKKTPNDLMEEDYRTVIKALHSVKKGDPRTRPEMVTIEHVKASLLTAFQTYQKDGRLDDALRFLALAREIGEPETAENVYREAVTQERRADELLAWSRVTKDPKESAEKREAALRGYSAAADAFVRHADLSTMDDVLFGASLWKAASLMDRAGRVDDAVKAYDRYVIQRPRDARVSEALYAMGQLHQAKNDFDAAIAAHERNRKENPKTPASYLSTVQLARCYMAKGEAFYKQAEDALLELVQDNPNLLPSANEFRVALFTLGELYYKWSTALSAIGGTAGSAGAATRPGDSELLKRRGSAILRLEEAIDRYPKDPLVGRSTFWLADCYRKSAADIGEAIRKEPAIAHRDSLERARQDRLLKAAGLYEAVIARLDKGGADGATLEDEYVRYSHVNRAECYFELEQYAVAIKLYDAVATRYAQSLTALEAYVQIVRGYSALKEPSQAQAAAERARWILKRIPNEAFGQAPLRLPREYYERFLELGGKGG